MIERSPPARPHIRWQADPIGRERREARAGHRGAVVWLTGLSGAGKTTLARATEARLFDRGARVYVLDAENVRHGLSGDLGFAPAARAEHVRRLGEVAGLFADAGVIAIVACISPYRADRAAVRARLGDDFIEVHVATPLAVCEARDPRGLYRRARAGEISSFTGVSAPYEAPEAPDLAIGTPDAAPDDGAARVVAALERRGVLSARPDQG